MQQPWVTVTQIKCSSLTVLIKLPYCSDVAAVDLKFSKGPFTQSAFTVHVISSDNNSDL